MSILKVENLKKYYTDGTAVGKKQQVKALDGVSFVLQENKTLGVVGESGCGKSTLARQLIQLEHPTSGVIKYNGKSWKELGRGTNRAFIQMIFQDPMGSLNPRKKCWQLISAPLLRNPNMGKKKLYDSALEMMAKVGLDKGCAERYPHMFSGGQRQRIGIARALVLKPRILICDEPVSALDVSIQAQVLNLLMKLQREFNLTYVFISHDLHVVKHISDDILVMDKGKVVEYGPSKKIFEDPDMPYTQKLLLASPSI